MGKHFEKSNAQEHPNMSMEVVSYNDILSMEAKDYLNWSINVFNEEFTMILEDLEKLADGRPILVEGVNLLPKLIKNEITDIDHAVWLVSNEAFYTEYQMQRKEMFERLKECSNPEQALKNYMRDDLEFGKYILNDARKFNLNVLVVEKESDIMRYAEVISSLFDKDLVQ
ncbi:MAG: hypothetical protein QM644_17820 [Mobilitalea sp.]